MGKKDLTELPHYPALNCCALIDARMASRNELRKDVKASALFENITEGKSLADGMAILEWQEVDACFLGPSLSPEKAAEFIRDAKTRVRSTDCAFIVVINAGDDATGELLRNAGAHGVIIRPCTKMTFTDGVVRAVISANADGVWAGLSLMYGHDNILAVMRDAGGKQRLPGVSPVLEEAIFSAMAASTEPQLRTILEAIDSGEIRLTPEGKPTRRAQQIIKAAVDEILSDDEAGGREGGSEVQQFKAFFYDSLCSWFTDIIQGDERDATEKLRRCLLAYRPGGETPEKRRPAPPGV